jgi:hypothetical protein
MDSIHKQEETGRDSQTIQVADSLIDEHSQPSMSNRAHDAMLTFRYSLSFSLFDQEICADDTDVDRQPNNARPPPDKITKQVNLFLRSVLHPEADSTQGMAS